MHCCVQYLVFMWVQILMDPILFWRNIFPKMWAINTRLSWVWGGGKIPIEALPLGYWC